MKSSAKANSKNTDNYNLVLHWADVTRVTREISGHVSRFGLSPISSVYFFQLLSLGFITVDPNIHYCMYCSCLAYLSRLGTNNALVYAS